MQCFCAPHSLHDRGILRLTMSLRRCCLVGWFDVSLSRSLIVANGVLYVTFMSEVKSEYLNL